MSFKPQVSTASSGVFCGNALAFATRAEAEANAEDLSYRWMAVRHWRAIESEDPVTHTYIDGELGYVSTQAAA